MSRSKAPDPDADPFWQVQSQVKEEEKCRGDWDSAIQALRFFYSVLEKLRTAKTSMIFDI